MKGRLAEVADWSPQVPLVEAARTAPTLPGVYVLSTGKPPKPVYVGMAGERRGRGLRGRLRVYESGKAGISGFGETALDRAFADPDWLADRLAEAEAGTPLRAKAAAALAVERLDPKVRWAVTGDRASALILEAEVMAMIPGLWNRRRK